MEQIVVHTVSRSSRVQELTRCQGQSLSVGRAFSNDLVVADPHVAAEQICFERSECGWQLRCFEQTNPVLLNGLALQGETAALKSGDRITIGRTQLQVYDIEHEFGPARPLPFSRFLNRDSIGFLLPTLAIAVCLGVSQGLQRLFTAIELDWYTELTAMAGSVMVIVVWAAFWALYGLRHRGAHFSQHLLCTALFFIALELTLYAISYLELLSSSRTLAEIAVLALGFALFAWLLKYNLSLATQLPRPTLTATLACTALFFLSLAGWIYRADQYSQEPYYSDTLGPASLLPASNYDAEQYLEAVAELGEFLQAEPAWLDRQNTASEQSEAGNQGESVLVED